MKKNYLLSRRYQRNTLQILFVDFFYRRIILVWSKSTKFFPKTLIVWIPINLIGFFLLRFLVKDLINSEFESIIQHSWNELPQQLTWTLNARVLINFDQPYFLVMTDKIIKPKKLKTVPSLVIIYFPFDWRKRHVSYLFHFLPNLTHFLFRHVFIQLLKR